LSILVLPEKQGDGKWFFPYFVCQLLLLGGKKGVASNFMSQCQNEAVGKRNGSLAFDFCCIVD
jgi:hypothetical protein